jgi:GNAT superfamily N-acetyltransferase
VKTFRIREVDGADDQADLAMLHEATFDCGEPFPDTLDGHWWMAFEGTEPIAFAGVVPSDRYPRTGYYKRVGVLPICRGAGLQMRFTRAIEARCRRNGWRAIVSDTRDNLPSANNFIRAGYQLFAPDDPWAFAGSLYWRKEL